MVRGGAQVGASRVQEQLDVEARVKVNVGVDERDVQTGIRSGHYDNSAQRVIFRLAYWELRRMRNRKSSYTAPFGAAGSRRGLMIAGLALCAACTTVIEEQGYDGLEVGITKAEALNRLDALPATVDVHAALPRPANTRPRTRGTELQVVRLAAASVGAGMLTPAERTYLLQYDLWYFEEIDGKRSVLITFDNDGVIANIDNRREAGWLEAVF
jgi:hypothetical protein